MFHWNWQDIIMSNTSTLLADKTGNLNTNCMYFLRQTQDFFSTLTARHRLSWSCDSSCWLAHGMLNRLHNNKRRTCHKQGVQKNLVKFHPCDFRVDRQKNRHTHHNTLHTYWQQNKQKQRTLIYNSTLIHRVHKKEASRFLVITFV